MTKCRGCMNWLQLLIASIIPSSYFNINITYAINQPYSNALEVIVNNKIKLETKYKQYSSFNQLLLFIKNIYKRESDNTYKCH